MLELEDADFSESLNSLKQVIDLILINFLRLYFQEKHTSGCLNEPLKQSFQPIIILKYIAPHDERKVEDLPLYA